MSLDLESVSPAEPVGYQEILNANWGERLVTVAAASIAVLVVAIIAVLMGMT